MPIALTLGHRGGGVARLLVRPRRLDRRGRRRFGARVPGRNARRARVRGAAALAARRSRTSSDIESLGQLLRAFAMPVLTLCCVIVAQMMRMSRAAVIDQLEAPYIEMVRLKGASPLRTVLAHALAQRGRSRSPMRSRSACRTCSAA